MIWEGYCNFLCCRNIDQLVLCANIWKENRNMVFLDFWSYARPFLLQKLPRYCWTVVFFSLFLLFPTSTIFPSDLLSKDMIRRHVLICCILFRIFMKSVLYFAVGMQVMKIYLVPANLSPSQYLSLWVFCCNPAPLPLSSSLFFFQSRLPITTSFDSMAGNGRFSCWYLGTWRVVRLSWENEDNIYKTSSLELSQALVQKSRLV